ncbi:MAG: PQQ-like beta-propeller repeat protein, partial [Planctomycetes bacterium]|nr:PQQ-like beta-propeller repeat protein [Planctomycetota bacterium]
MTTRAFLTCAAACVAAAMGLATPAACGAEAAAGAEGAAADGLIASPEAGWPQWRGPRRDGVSLETGLLQAWPEGGPRLLWTASGLGRGWSSPIITGGRIYITGEVGDDLRIFALDLEGKKVWDVANGAAWKDPHPGARATCAYSDGRLYHMNAHGRVACLDAADGREVWAADVLERFAGRQLTWALSE